jgi:ectoine hydroxylase-related dioxygenase (phytanoyl-CoA dioxygenase family)
VNHQDLQRVSSFIRTDGYAIVPDVFSAIELKSAANQLADSTLKRSRAGARHVMSCPAVAEIANHKGLLSIAWSVLGAHAIPFRATFFDKSPDSNWLVTWHQDTALPLKLRRDVLGWGPWSVKDGLDYAHAPSEALEKVLALRVHLDDSTSKNGPLRIIPATHLSGVLTDDEILRRAEDSRCTECTVGVGGVIAMHPLIIHASSKSESEFPRRLLHIEYAADLEIVRGIRLAVV